MKIVLPSAGTAATFVITHAKLYVPVVTLKIEDNAKLLKFLILIWVGFLEVCFEGGGGVKLPPLSNTC